MVRQRWALGGGVPERLTLLVDSTVVVRDGLEQAGAERGDNSKQRRRAYHYPLLAFVKETGDCLGVGGRAGSAQSAADAAQ